MADSYFGFEARLRQLGVIERGEFITAAGQPANLKVNLENVPEEDPRLAAEMASILAIRLCLYKPDIIVPVPKGANRWGQEVAAHMSKDIVKLRWRNKKAGTLRYLNMAGKQTIEEAGRIAIVEDVFTTGGNIEKVAAFPGLAGKVVAAGAFWNRSATNPEPAYPVVTLIDSYVPLIEND